MVNIDALTKAVNVLKQVGDFGIENDAKPLSSYLNKTTMTDILNKCILVDHSEIKVPLQVNGSHFTPTSSGTYIVTGGSRGFGLSIVQWLIAKGVCNIVVLSRTRPTVETLKTFEKSGCLVTFLETDITEPTCLEERIVNIKQTMPVVEGIFHCAAKYGDTWLNSMSHDGWMDVVLPKAYGAQLLHELSVKHNLPVQHFVMISSLVSYIGNSGQSNYCAANSYLNNLAEYRQSKGLPAKSIGFGIISDVGFAARGNLVSMWEKRGLYSMDSSEALNGLDACLSMNTPHICVSKGFDKERFSATNKTLLEYHHQNNGFISRLKNLLKSSKTPDSGNHSIHSMSTKDAIAYITEGITEYLVDNLGYSDKDALLQDVSPVTLGLDSLLATDMSNFIHETYGISILPVELLNDKTTIKSLVGNIKLKINGKISNSGKSEQVKGTDEEVVPESKWYSTVKAIPNASMQLICFPPLGGGMSQFVNWQVHLARHNIQVNVVQLPGWEGRPTEKPIHDMKSIVSEITDAIKPLVESNAFVFYGHSFGALLAFETSHLLKTRYELSPLHLYLGAWFAPTVKYRNPRHFSHSMFEKSTPLSKAVDGAKQFKIFEESTLKNSGQMSRMLPCLQSGVIMCENYTYTHECKLSCHITVFAGSKDKFASVNKMSGWKKRKTCDFNYRKVVVNGKHMFINDEDIVNCEVIASIVSDNVNLM